MFKIIGIMVVLIILAVGVYTILHFLFRHFHRRMRSSEQNRHRDDHMDI